MITNIIPIILIIFIIIIIIFIIILINTRWMNGSGRGALLFESEGRWSMKVALLVFTDIASFIIGEI